MGNNTPQKVVNLIRANVLRIRTGLWLIPITQVGQERNEAAKLMLDSIDIRTVLLEEVPAGSRFSGLSDQKVMALLDKISERPGDSDCTLVYNLDILLSRLTYQEVSNVWQYVFEFFPHRSRALLLTIPVTAQELLPTEEKINVLARENRYVNTAQ